jgi:homoserine kinase type II
VLTLYERLPADELPFYLNLMAHLARAGVEAPAPAADRTGAYFSILNGKPASLVARVDGEPMLVPDAPHCAAVGSALGRLHLASSAYRTRLTNRRGPAWWRQAARAVRPFLDARQNELLAAELKFQTGFGKGRMPRGAIHGDLFCDNVLFVGDRVSGIIDFGFAATDFLAYDLAITVNDWCIVRDGADTGGLVGDLVVALVGAYQQVRPLSPDERAQWPALLRAAALRFWLSRLYDLHLPRSGELVHAHDPDHFERILRDRVACDAALPEPRDAGMSATMGPAP